MGSRKLYWDNSPFVEYMQENNLLDEREKELISFSDKSHQIDEFGTKKNENIEALTAANQTRKNSYWNMIKEVFDPREFTKRSLKHGYEETLNSCTFFSAMKQRIQILSICLGISIFLFEYICLRSETLLKIFNSMLAILLTLAFLFYKKNASQFKTMNQILIFLNSKNDDFEEIVIKMIKFFREFMLIQRGQRLGTLKEILILAESDIHPVEAISAYRQSFIELRGTIRLNILKNIEILISILQALNHDKTAIYEKLKESNKSEEADLKVLQALLEIYVNLLEEIKHELNIYLTKYTNNLIDINLFRSIESPLRAFSIQNINSCQEIASTYGDSKKKSFEPDERKIDKKHESLRKHINIMKQNYKTLKRHTQSILLTINQQEQDDEEIKSQIKYLQNLQEEICLDHKAIFDSLLSELKSNTQKPKTSESVTRKYRNIEDENDDIEADILYHDDQIPDKDKILRVFEVDAEAYQEHLNFRRNLDDEGDDKQPKVNLEPVLRELKDILKSRKDDKPSKYYIKTKEGRFIEVDPNTLPKKEDKLKDEENVSANSSKNMNYHIAPSESFAINKMDLFAELKSLRK